MDALFAVLDVALLASTIRLVSPILLAALGGLLSERVGIFNVGLEGLMLAGAFFAVAGTYWTGNPWVGLALAVVAAVLLSLVFAIVVVDLGGDAIVAGLALNLFALGLTTYLIRPVFGVQGSFYDPKMPSLPDIHIFGSRERPDPRATRLGLLPAGLPGVRAGRRAPGLAFPAPVGHPHQGGRRVARGGRLGRDPVRRTRYLALLGDRRAVRPGRGPAVDLAGHPVRDRDDRRARVHRPGGGDVRPGAPAGVLGASLLFGFMYALTLRLQGGGIPPQFVAMLPYVTTIIVLVLYAVRQRRRVSAARSAVEEVTEDSKPTPA